MRWLAWLLLACSTQAAAQEGCTSATPTPLLHPAPALVRSHAFQRLPRRMGVETLRLRDGFTTTLLREGCEGFGVTFDVGPMPAPPTAATLHAAARAYMRQLLRVDPHFWIARRFLDLKTRGTMQGRRLRIEDGQSNGQSSFEIGADDSEPGRLLIVYAAVL